MGFDNFTFHLKPTPTHWFAIDDIAATSKPASSKEVLSPASTQYQVIKSTAIPDTPVTIAICNALILPIAYLIGLKSYEVTISLDIKIYCDGFIVSLVSSSLNIEVLSHCISSKK